MNPDANTLPSLTAGCPPAWVGAYPALAAVASNPLLAPGLLALPVMAIAAGTQLFQASAPCQGFPLIIEGEVAVSRSSGDGRHLELYRVTPGELCLVSSACLFRAQPLSASGTATQASRLVLVPPHQFHAWLAVPAFRDAVLGLFAERMADLTALVDAVAFHQLDQRLAAALLGHGADLNITHQALADQLGTVREIVTRLLRRFEREGWVTLGREHIHINHSAALRQRAQGPADGRTKHATPLSAE
jgi:CRP/FNR family transcriptional regulator, anaerobic regulatory protein